jgi:hypothetical protein
MRPPASYNSKKQRKVLADRFKITLHREMSELSVSPDGSWRAARPLR